MVYRYVSKKFAGSLTRLIRTFSKLQENGDTLQAGAEFDRPILPLTLMQPVIPSSSAQSDFRVNLDFADQSPALNKQASISNDSIGKADISKSSINKGDTKGQKKKYRRK